MGQYLEENDDEFIYFNAVGLAYADISIAYAMYKHAIEQGFGKVSSFRNNDFDKDLTGKVVL